MDPSTVLAPDDECMCGSAASSCLFSHQVFILSCDVCARFSRFFLSCWLLVLVGVCVLNVLEVMTVFSAPKIPDPIFSCIFLLS